ncbi:MAG: glycosyltransferase family 2 protein [Anaerolineaceae bacterium]|jgi:glycosyltransferase involved in cell wall biosynthesis|nr:glycosyltransferase family 2 protein [Anaerolineaceae bacterium]OQY88419.1 MAG: glycosyltransferase [Anaerolineae bacterium UTCFX1]
MTRKLISVVTPCYNEAENVDELYERIRAALDGREYEHIFIDNASTDDTQAKIRALAEKDPRVKAVFNTRNFGHIRSPYYALLQAAGDAIITLAADLQDPPERIPEFIAQWERGYKVVIGVKTKSQERGLFYLLRTLYYRGLRSLSDVDLIEHFTGFGLYDRQIVDILRKLDDPYPYFRGMIADLGFPIARIEFEQPRRKRGISKNNFYTLYDMAMLGMTGYTKVPLRLAAMFGFFSALVSFLIGSIYLLYKIIFWFEFSLGSAPIVVGLFFLGSVQLFFLGIVGEYIGAIYTQVMRRPLVIEKERINF